MDTERSEFQKKLPKSYPKWLSRFLNMIWPQMGWRRYGNLMRHRLGRMQDSSYSIAAGFACGAALSVTPLFGFHILIAVCIAWALRANLIAAALGTLVGNPWTYPIFLYWDYEIGRWLLNHEGPDNLFETLNFAAIRTHPLETLKPVLWPMMVGSAPLVIMVWCVTCWLLYTAIKRYKSQRLEQRHRRALQLLQRMKANSDTPAKED